MVSSSGYAGGGLERISGRRGVLYPSLGLVFFCVEDPVFQEGLFRTYNDWLIEYCKGAPDRLFGVALISAFDIDHALAEMERCKREGMVGTLIWQVPCSGANSPVQPLLVIPAFAGMTISGVCASLGWRFDTAC